MKTLIKLKSSFFVLYLQFLTMVNKVKSYAVAEVITEDKKCWLLINIFGSEIKYHKVAKILIGKNIFATDYSWIDYGKGSKCLMVQVIKHLKVRGYFKKNFTLTNEIIKEIIWNSFREDVSIDYIKHIYVKDITIDYIPDASNI